MAVPSMFGPKIAKKLHVAASKMDWIEKRGKNEAQKYAYVMADDVAAACRDIFKEVGIAVTANVIGTTVRQIDGNNKKINVVGVDVEWSFIDTESGEGVTVRIPGEGMDSGDKAIYKAMTGSLKYALKMNFLIPTGEDPEADSEADKEVYVPAAAKPAAKAAAKPAAAPKGDGFRLAFGKHKGKLASDPSIPTEDLEWLAGAVRKSIDDPDKANFKDKNKVLLGHLNIELAQRSGEVEEVAQSEPDDEIPF